MPTKTILYDDNCPLCCWYTDAFVRTGLLATEGRRSFTSADLKNLPDFDLERSKDEIPLLDDHGGTTLYGIDSLVYLLSQRWSWIRTVATWPAVNWFLRRLYKLISYNRRVIVAKPTPPGAFDCSPRFDLFYRSLYLGIALLVGVVGITWHGFATATSFTALTVFAMLLSALLPIQNIESRETLIHCLGILLTPLVPVGVLLMATALLPVLHPYGPFAALGVGGWMWYRRSAL